MAPYFLGGGLPPHSDSASPREAVIGAKGSTTSGYVTWFFTVARPAGGGWGSCGQRRTVMTRARALKQVIRARSAKTGERYTTARRHILRELNQQPLNDKS